VLPKLYHTAHPRTPWLVVYTDPSARDRHNRPKRVQKWFSDRKPAKTYHDSLLRQAATVGTSGLTWNAQAIADYQASRDVLKDADYTDVSLTEAARAFVRDRPAALARNRKLAPIVQAFLAAKRHDNTAPPTVRNLKYRVDAWVKRNELTTLADVGDRALRAIKERPGVSTQTRINDMAAVSSFLSWLVEQGLTATNPLLTMSRPKTDARSPRVLRPAQIRALLEAALALGRGRLVRYLALQLLAGLRPGEAAQVTPDQVRLAAVPPFVRVLRGKKRTRPRPATVFANFEAWWNAAPWPNRTTEKRGEPVPLWRASRDRRLFDAVRARAGLVTLARRAGARPARLGDAWQGDICRHSWISARLQQTKDEARTAYEAGTSVEMIHGHYLDLYDDAEVAEIEAIRPAKRRLTKTRRSAKPTG
jgi:integrase